MTAAVVWLQPLWQTGQPAPEDATADETAPGPPKKKNKGNRKSRDKRRGRQ